MLQISSRDTTLTERQILQKKEFTTKIQCKCGNPAQLICINSKCQKYPFVCSNNQKDCKSYCHQNCLKITLKNFHENLQKKVLNVSQFVEQHDKIVQDFIDVLIEEASKMKQVFKGYAQQNYRYFSMTGVQRQIWFKMQANDVQDIKSRQFLQIIAQLGQFQDFSKQMTARMGKQKLIQQWKNIQQILMSELSKFQMQFLQSSILLDVQSKVKFQNSSIIKTQQQMKIVWGFFSKSIQSVELLYKASQNQFKLKKFYQKCTGIPNTLCIIETEFGKKIGGFTPLCWKKAKKVQFLVDQTNSSFLFSLTNNQKFSQKSVIDCGIWNYPNYGFAFGGPYDWDLCISNQSNKNPSSAKFDYGYKNQAYKKWDQQTLQSFNGSPNNSHAVKSKEWQVWRVVFQQQETNKINALFDN